MAHCHPRLILQDVWLIDTLFRAHRFEDWNAKETEFLNETQLITSKPVVYLLNLSEKNYVAKKGKWLKPVFEWVQVRRRFTRRRPSRCWSAFAHTLSTICKAAILQTSLLAAHLS